MAMNTDQKASSLFKKSLGKGSTTTSKDFFEEPKDGRPSVLPFQIWAEGASIPSTAPSLIDGQTDGVVKRYVDLVLTQISGVPSAYYHADLVDAIPFNYGDGSYNYAIKNNSGGPIAFGVGDWILDTDTGVLTFYGTTPSGMPPKVSFYRYVGLKGIVSTLADNSVTIAKIATSQVYSAGQLLSTDGSGSLSWTGKLKSTQSYSTPVLITIASNAGTMSCATSDVFYSTGVTGAAVITITGIQSGQGILYAVTAGGTAATVTFTGSGLTVQWSSGTANNVVTANKTYMFNLMCISTTVYVVAAVDFA